LAEVVPLQRPTCPRRSVRRGEALCATGDPFRALYVVCCGTLKSVVTSRNGLIQVTGFRIAGDIIGLDGISSELHQTDVVALDDVEVFVLPFPQCQQWSRESAFGQRLLMRALAHEITCNRKHMLALGTARAEQRMAIFLLELSQRHERLGHSRSQFILPMTRRDLGSYLGLTLETVSRLLSRLQRECAIQVQGQSLALLDFPALRRMAGASLECSTHPVDRIVDPKGNFLVAD
jgi:CRP/FNR family transcriptional regulator